MYMLVLHNNNNYCFYGMCVTYAKRNNKQKSLRELTWAEQQARYETRRGHARQKNE